MSDYPKIECTCIEAYKTRKMRDPNCCTCSCDYNDVVEENQQLKQRIEQLERERDENQKLREEIKRLKSPDLFWVKDDTEMGFNSIEELFEYHFSSDTKKGLRLEVMQAAILPDSTYELTELNEDGSFEVEALNNE